MKLEEVLSKELFEQVKVAIDAVNAKETDKLKHVRFTDLSEGGYISKEKYTALETDKGSVAEQLKTAQDLIEELKKGTKSDDTLQGKIGEYETTITTLTAENERLKEESALKVALIDGGAKVSDLDYLMFKVRSEEKEIKIVEGGKLKGQDDLIAGLKTQFPANFTSEQKKTVQEHKLEQGEGDNAGAEPKSLSEALQMEYEKNKE